MTEEEKELQVRIGARVWIEAARIMWFRLYPDRQCPIGDYEDMDQKGRIFMHTVMSRVVEITSDPEKMRKIADRFMEDGIPL